MVGFLMVRTSDSSSRGCGCESHPNRLYQGADPQEIVGGPDRGPIESPPLVVFLSSFRPCLPLEVCPLNPAIVWGAVSSLGGVWGRTPAEIEYGEFYP